MLDIRRILSVTLVLLLTTFAAAAGDLATSENLFFIKRSKNANEVHYDARTKSCAWSRPEVDSYWRDVADGPDDYEEIKWFEDRAYGFEVERSSNSAITIRLKALPEQAISARLSPAEGGDCAVSVTTKINGEDAELRSVYVYATANAIGFPAVHYIEILGYSGDAEPVWQRLPQSKKGRKMDVPRPDDSRWKSGAPTWGRG